MNNYGFCVNWVLDQAKGNELKVLDYGCGAGEVVRELRTRGINAFGCDVFYEGGDTSDAIDASLMGTIIRKMEDASIPFGDGTFDLVINNQVMEHAEDLDAVLRDIARVLKPGGALLNLFPDKSVWREGHSGVPFLHWFSKGSRPRLYYAAACRVAGLGSHKKKWEGIMHWSRHKCDWLDKWTFYRTEREITAAYGKYFDELRYIEHEWLHQRYPSVARMPAALQRIVVRKLAGLVFIARRHEAR
jgi:SAM-dependent methyltransferase